MILPVDMGVSENRENPFLPNGFADHEIPFLNGYFIGKINPIFRHTHMLILGWLTLGRPRLELFTRPGPQMGTVRKGKASLLLGEFYTIGAEPQTTRVTVYITTCVYTTYLHTSIHPSTHPYIHIYIYIHVYIYVYIYIIYIYIYICT